MSDYRSNILKPSEVGELKKHPILDDLSDDLKSLEKYREIEKTLNNIMLSDHKHKTMKAFKKCSQCEKKMIKKRNKINSYGFKSYHQYLQWKKVMDIVNDEAQKGDKKAQAKDISEELKKAKWEKSIKALNDTITSKIGVSDIHGVGVFALRDFKKGERLYLNIIPNMYDLPYSMFDKLNKDAVDMILQFFPAKSVDSEQTQEDKITDGNAQVFWYPVNNMQAYLNHSDNPNYDGKDDVALRKIKKGEEITEDYRKIKGWDKVSVYNFLK